MTTSGFNPLVIGVLVGIVAVAAVICFVFIFISKKKRNATTDNSNLYEYNNNSYNETNSTINNTANPDELRKYKALLDDGIITQEEFEAKKKELLNL